VGAGVTVAGLFGGEEEIVHVGLLVVPEEGGVVEPAVFLDVLGVAATFPGADGVVVFGEVEVGDIPGGLIELCGPAEDRLWEGVDGEGAFRENEGDEEGVGIDDDGAAAAEALDHGDGICLDLCKIEELAWFSGDSHDDGAGRAAVDETEVALVGAQERLFELELLEDRLVFKKDQVKRCHLFS